MSARTPTVRGRSPAARRTTDGNRWLRKLASRQRGPRALVLRYARGRSMGEKRAMASTAANGFIPQNPPRSSRLPNSSPFGDREHRFCKRQRPFGKLTGSCRSNTIPQARTSPAGNSHRAVTSPPTGAGDARENLARAIAARLGRRGAGGSALRFLADFHLFVGLRHGEFARTL